MFCLGEMGFLPVLEDDFLAWYSVKSFWVYTCQGNMLEFANCVMLKQFG